MYAEGYLRFSTNLTPVQGSHTVPLPCLFLQFPLQLLLFSLLYLFHFISVTLKCGQGLTLEAGALPLSPSSSVSDSHISELTQ